MPEIEFVYRVRDFVEQGGDVLLVLAFVTAVMWAMIWERIWYFRSIHKKEVSRVRELWAARSERRSWQASAIRRMLLSDVRLKLQQRLGPIDTLVKVCPMLGLLGTVTGMIEVFDVMAIAGGGNPRAMAAGVSKATIPTMAGMVAALSGLALSVRLERFAREETKRVEDHLIQE